MEDIVIPEWPFEDVQTSCEGCGRKRYDTKTRLNMTGRPELCAECFESQDVRASYGG
jgi:hypothetical protein